MAQVSFTKPNGKTPLFDIKRGQLFLGVADKVHIRTVTGSVRLDDGYSFSNPELIPYAAFEVLPTGTTIIVTA